MAPDSAITRATCSWAARHANTSAAMMRQYLHQPTTQRFCLCSLLVNTANTPVVWQRPSRLKL